MAMAWLRKNFGPTSRTALKANDEYRALIFDGHNSHVNPDFLHYSVQNKIIPICLPPHTTHRLQPLDMCIFSAFKKHYSSILNERYTSRFRGVGKSNFYLILSEARGRAFTSENIRSGFWYTGLIPIDRSIVIGRINSPRQIQPSNPDTTTRRNEPLEPLQDINSFEAEELYSLETPRKRRALYDISQMFLNGLNQTQTCPEAWRFRVVAQKITNSAESSMLKVEAMAKEIDDLKERLREKSGSQPSKRTRIPMEGMVVRTRQGIEEFFVNNSEREREKKEKRIELLKEKITRLTSSLAIVQEKRKKAELKEQENTLPKRWKSSFNHSQDERKIQEQLDEVSSKLVEAERETSDMNGVLTCGSDVETAGYESESEEIL